LALRDLVRYQARSGAALAAVTLALGIAATAVIIASAEAAKKAAEPATLSDRQMRVYLGPPDDRELTPTDAPAQLERLTAGVRRLAAQLDAETVIPLRKAVQPGAAAFVLGNTRVFPTVELARQVDTPEGQKQYRAESAPMSPRWRSQVPRDRLGPVEPARTFLRPQRPLMRSTYRARGSARGRSARRHNQATSGKPFSARLRTPPTFVTPNGLRCHG
jgi:hypothetical protein